jgi:predicted secreted Zn-dependent protease
VTIELVLPIVNSFTVSPTTITRGGSGTLSWNVSGATSVTIDQGVGTVSATSGTQTVNPTATTVYTLTATNNDGNKTATCTLTVDKLYPTINYFLSNPTAIQLGNSSALTWSVQNADTVVIDQGVGSVAATGSRQVSPTATTTYTLTATNIDGQRTASCQVEILRAAILTISTVPPNSTWIYSGIYNTSTSTFSVVLTESNNIGGTITDLLIGTFLNGVLLSAQDFGSGNFFPLGTLTFPNCVVVATGMPNQFIILAEGVDLSGYPIEVAYVGTIAWSTATSATTLELRAIDSTRGDPSVDGAIRQLKRSKR